MDFEQIVVGAGVVGLAVAAELAPLGETLVLEREEGFGRGTSSRNSEVVHAGIYYDPGSLKARLCVEGRRAIEGWAAEGRFGYRQVGKYIVAVNASESDALDELLARGRANGVEGLRLVGAEELAVALPGVRAVAGLFSPATGIVDSHGLMRFLATRAESAGAVLACRSRVVALEPVDGGWELQVEEGPEAPPEDRAPERLPRSLPATGPRQRLTARRVVIAAGLHSDALLALAGVDVEALGLRQWWSRGEYFAPRAGRVPALGHLVYPVPSAAGGGHLGLHLTVDLGGGLRFGPSVAWLEPAATRVEDYRQDRGRATEFAVGVSRYLPGLTAADLEPAGVGLRPLAFPPGAPPVDFRVLDFGEHGRPGLWGLVGIESPGLTAAPAIGRLLRLRLEASGS